MSSLARAHLVERGAAGRLAAVAGPAGLVLGRDDAGAPVIVRLLRREPTRVALVGGWWSARLLAFRVLGLGARVVVRTAAPNMWAGLAEAAGAGARFALVPQQQSAPQQQWSPQHGAVLPGAGPVLPLAGDAAGGGPVLQIDDAGPAGPMDRPEAEWQTQVTLLPQLTAQGAQALADADLVMLQRLGRPDAELAAGVLRLPGRTALLLQQMHDDMVAIVGGGADRYAWFTPTIVERQVLGPARRG